MQYSLLYNTSICTVLCWYIYICILVIYVHTQYITIVIHIIHMFFLSLAEVLGVPSTVLSGAHHANASMSWLSVQWTPVNGSEGYIVVATAYNGDGNHMTVTNTVLNSQLQSGSAVFKVSTILFFQISCASRFIFQVAAFNSGSQGHFSKLEEKTTVSTDCEITTTIGE